MILENLIDVQCGDGSLPGPKKKKDPKKKKKRKNERDALELPLNWRSVSVPGIGVWCRGRFSPPPLFPEGATGPKTDRSGLGRVQELGRPELESEFRRRCTTAPSTRNGARGGFPDRYMVRQARACDISVLGSARGALAEPLWRSNPRDLVMQGRSPRALSFPKAVSGCTCAAWLVARKDTVEASGRPAMHCLAS